MCLWTRASQSSQELLQDQNLHLMPKSMQFESTHNNVACTLSTALETLVRWVISKMSNTKAVSAIWTPSTSATLSSTSPRFQQIMNGAASKKTTLGHTSTQANHNQLYRAIQILFRLRITSDIQSLHLNSRRYLLLSRIFTPRSRQKSPRGKWNNPRSRTWCREWTNWTIW